MPFRDHFRPPLDDITSWDGFYGGWPAVIVQQFHKVFPPGYVAGPRIHLGLKADSDFPVYEVRVYDATQGDRRLVATIEIVSPGNKDRPKSRTAFVARCAALLQQGVAVSLIDPVTIYDFNLYADLMALLGHVDSTLGDPPPSLYAGTCRPITKDNRNMFEAWSHRLVVGQPLPTLPLWLSPTRVVPLDLEPGYEQTCHDLWLA